MFNIYFNVLNEKIWLWRQKQKISKILLCFYAKRALFYSKPYKLLGFFPKLDNLNYICIIFVKLNQKLRDIRMRLKI